ncbi:aconitase [Desulfonatronum thiosulfatophilum]|uniref:Aconitate hydratase A n=1 Tax=Desulfonatronum thiosulfatophilum TaxID=617002 RepID=A0A1G6AU38_9BACT|nr:aconitate hydratase [Desulfonatronum thiosulfatophilum]SDB11901.1 aconitase [Desulfonatronum thiosulfatophilum]
MGRNLTRKIIRDHLVSGEMIPGREISLRIDQTLTQDATGTMAYLQWMAMGLDRVRTELSVSYVDHNTLQMGFQNADDHRFLRSVAARYGIVFSPPGTGICHQLHLENFARPGKTLIGSDSHTPTAGGVGSLAMGAGGLSVALAMAGEPYTIPMPKVFQIHLTGRLQAWAGAKDIILHVLGLLSVKGGVGAVLEYAGPGVDGLTVPERATITNMGAELGATASVFPSDEQTREFLTRMGRPEDFAPLSADPDASYDQVIEIDLDSIEPMAARPHMPDLVVPIRELDGLAVDQVAIGSCTNSSYTDLKTAALVLRNRQASRNTDLFIAPGSKQVLKLLNREGLLEALLDSGARLLECSCGPCIGMGGSPTSAGVSLRTFNRNFEGRSGTQDAQVYLVGPAAAAQAALVGRITDPKTWGAAPEKPTLPQDVPSIRHLFIMPPPQEQAQGVEICCGPNIVPLEEFSTLPRKIEAQVLIVLGDNVTTDHILPGGAAVTALRSNLPAISKFIFNRVDQEFVVRAEKAPAGIIVGGENYGQGSSREHAALGPRHLGVRIVLAKSFARIHKANLINFGILPLVFANPDDHARLTVGQAIELDTVELASRTEIPLQILEGAEILVRHDLTVKELEIINAGGLLNMARVR